MMSSKSAGTSPGAMMSKAGGIVAQIRGQCRGHRRGQKHIICASVTRQRGYVCASVNPSSRHVCRLMDSWLPLQPHASKARIHGIAWKWWRTVWTMISIMVLTFGSEMVLSMRRRSSKRIMRLAPTKVVTSKGCNNHVKVAGTTDIRKPFIWIAIETKADKCMVTASSMKITRCVSL